jgi:hypothetical protein
MKIECSNEDGDCSLDISLTDLAAIRALISVAVWIRSEQLAHEGEVIQIDCHDLHKEVCRAQLMEGTRLYKELIGMDLPKLPWMKL